MRIIKRNLIFIILFLGVSVCILKKDNYLPMPIVTHPDSQLAFSTNQNVLEQTWQSNVKKITQINVPYTATMDFYSGMKLQVLLDNSDAILAEAVVARDFKEGEKGQLCFDFEALPVTLGERYRIQLSYENSTESGEIMIDTGSNYMGCSIDGKEMGQAAAITITFTKSSQVFWLFASFFPVMAFTLLLMTVWNRKWEETIGVSLIGMIFVMYVFGLFDKLEVGINVVYFLAVASLITAFILYNKKRMETRDLFSLGLVVYGVLMVLIMVNCQGAFFARWDEYSHWGLAAKDMFYFDSFSKHIDTTVMLTRYPPFITLVEYFFNYTNGLFSQSIVYVGFQITLLSALILLCKAANGKKIKLLWSALIMMVGIPIIFFYDAYNSIYVDVLLAVWVAYILICHFSEKESVFNWIRIIGGLFALTLTKETGVILAGVVALIIVADVVWNQWRERKFSRSELWGSLSALVFVCLFFLSWQVYLKMPVEQLKTDQVGEEQVVATSNAISDSGITFDGINSFIKGEAPQYRYEVARNYIKVIFSEETYQLGPISVSYIDLMIIMIMLAGGISASKVWEDKEKRFITFAVLAFGIGMIYVAFLLVTYLFSFSIKEALLLHSHTRYLGSYLCGVILAELGLLLMRADKIEKIENREKTWKIVLGITAILLIAIPFDGLFIKNMDTEITEDQVYGYDDMAEVVRSFAKGGESVYFVCNNSEGYAFYIFRNRISPLLVSNGGWNLFESEETYRLQNKLNEENGIETKGSPTYLSVKEWGECLKDFDYVFLFHVNEVFEQSYAEMFETDMIKDGSFYQVVNGENGVKLKYVGSVGVKEYR